MGYKTLLVHLDDSARRETRLALALDLTGRFDAHLIGRYLPMPYPRTPAAYSAPALEQRREQAQAAFLDAGARAGCRVEWRAPQPGDTVAAALHARHADLLVLGQHERGDHEIDPSSDFVMDLLMTAARLAIVVPHSGAFPTIAENILIAWDGGREAARAASDALPLLRRASRCRIPVTRCRCACSCVLASSRSLPTRRCPALDSAEGSWRFAGCCATASPAQSP